MREAQLTDSGSGLAPATEGWFVVNVRDAEWWSSETRGAACWFANEYGQPPIEFAQFGINVTVFEPGQSSVYHAETNQEAFLVLRGECRLLVEGEERDLGPWDSFHCPPWTEHAFVGAGDRPCAILMVGAHLGTEVRYRCRRSPRCTARASRKRPPIRGRFTRPPSGSGESGRRTGPACRGRRYVARNARRPPSPAAESSLFFAVASWAAGAGVVPEGWRGQSGSVRAHGVTWAYVARMIAAP